MTPLPVLLGDFWSAILAYVFFYPVLMSVVWMIGGIDGDARLDPCALNWLVRHFDEPDVAAVTGNPRVRNRSPLLGRIQVGEFSSIVGLIKRAQRSVGLIFTVAWVIAAFRHSALHEVGYWSPEKLTEDVDISWKLQLAGWEVRFEPRALCWILMPETLRGLWKQRLRWSMGGTQVLLDYTPQLLSPKNAAMWPLCVEYGMSITSAYLFALLATYRVIDLLVYRIDLQSAPILLLWWTGLLIATTCLLQIMLSLVLDRPYDREPLKNYFWMIWYPIIYWAITAATSVVAVPKILFRDSEKRARWTSPDRGIKPDASR
ncbi:glycosyltransferase family 2 protein [Accumulibacter sp.]|uniref:glycosyltransferase family 2 protein n=1 Tax=Accumulibacter sp. TaxID=2053492 RepID=UPI0035ADA118